MKLFGAASGVRAEPFAVVPESFAVVLVAVVQALSMADPASSAEP